MRFLSWFKTIRVYRVGEEVVVADRAGWIPGRVRTVIGAYLLAVRTYLGR